MDTTRRVNIVTKLQRDSKELDIDKLKWYYRGEGSGTTTTTGSLLPEGVTVS